MTIVYPLSPDKRGDLKEHLIELSHEDRRLRFGGPTSDDTIAGYVENIDFTRDAVFGIRDDAGRLIASAHVAHLEDVVELGLSVQQARRGLGLAQALMRRAMLHARNRGIRELYMHCLAENAAMTHISRKAGMRIVIDGPERDAWLSLPPATPMSVGEEFRQGQLVLLDWTLRRVARRALEREPEASAVCDLA